jgi:hypothetical protein
MLRASKVNLLERCIETLKLNQDLDSREDVGSKRLRNGGTKLQLTRRDIPISHYISISINSVLQALYKEGLFDVGCIIFYIDGYHVIKM